MKTKGLLFVLLLCSCVCAAEYTDHALYEAYLRKDMTVWQAYIDQADWSRLSKKEKARLLNYEYGYAAYISDADAAAADFYLKQFNQHIEDSAGDLPASTIASYRSAYCAFMTKVDKWRMLNFATKSLRYADEAIAADLRDPIALALYGNVKMYTPKTFGGNKETAIQYYRRAEAWYEAEGETRNNWNYRALQLCMIQCYEKTGQVEKALDKCRAVLADEPEFAYLRDVYLPLLEAQVGYEAEIY